VAVGKATLSIDFVGPGSFELAHFEFQSKYKAKEYAEFVKALLTICSDPHLSDAFQHRIHNDYLWT
jgi:hypothetical protein